MARKGALHKAIGDSRKGGNNSTSFYEITIGEVVDTDDPQQMGRIRIKCPYFGDMEDDPISKIPLATYVSPLAGSTFSPTRGRGNDQTAGQIGYGMFNIPKVGSSVLVACIDADPRFRVWLGCVHDQFFPHTLPHGRYSYKTENQPEGPFSSSEDKIQPLYDSQTNAFSGNSDVEPRKSFEFRTRAADVSAAGLKASDIDTEDSTVSKLADDIDVKYSDNPAGGEYTNTQGYQKSRLAGDIVDVNTKESVYDPQTYSWTTPGFHSLSMQDNAENCRVRFRTTHGHQIIMDDTNERIYISTAGGKTWIEMDEVGNIDIYGERNISVHAEKDINFVAGGKFSVEAEDGIHLSTGGEARISAFTGVHLQSDDTVKIKGATMFIESDDDVDIKAAGNFIADGGGTSSLLAGGNVLLTGAQVHFNGPPAPPAAGTSGILDPLPASRKPEHEPWARTMTLEDGSAELTYDSPDVGRTENGEDLGRNPKWHR